MTVEVSEDEMPIVSASEHEEDVRDFNDDNDDDDAAEEEEEEAVVVEAVVVEEGPLPCLGGCGFFGTEANEGYCSRYIIDSRWEMHLISQLICFSQMCQNETYKDRGW